MPARKRVSRVLSETDSDSGPGPGPDSDGSIAGSPDRLPAGQDRPDSPTTAANAAAPPVPMHTIPLLLELLPPAEITARSILDVRKSMSQASFLLHTFGSSSADIRRYLQKARWNGQMLFPRRRIIPHHQQPQAGAGSGSELARNPSYSPAQIDAEVLSTAWHSDLHQQAEPVGAAIAGAGKQPERVILGPADRLRMFEVPVGGVVSLGDVWARSPDAPADDSAPSSIKTGFILNAGGRIQCLEWAPNVIGRHQYLLVSCFDASITFNSATAPAFEYRDCGPGQIQIWSLAERQEDQEPPPAPSTTHADFARILPPGSGQMDQQAAPRLELLINSGWGPARFLKWCPVATAPLGLPSPDGGGVDLGLLAGVWADGVCRVLRVTIPPGPAAGTRSVHVRAGAVEIRPPGTVCSALAWMSGRILAVGCANGAVLVWDLKQGRSEGAPAAAAAAAAAAASPLFMIPAVGTYILSLAPVHPHPHLLAVSSMSGYTSILDLSSPAAVPAPITNPRTRLISRPLAFHQLEQCVLTVDENYALRAHPVRRIHNEVFVGRLGATANDVATSPVQPGILVGCQDGMVAAMVMGGRLAGLRRGGRVGGVWFVFQWRRGRQDGDGPGAGGDDLHTRPLSRFVDGFQPEIVASAAAPKRQRDIFDIDVDYDDGNDDEDEDEDEEDDAVGRSGGDDDDDDGDDIASQTPSRAAPATPSRPRRTAGGTKPAAAASVPARPPGATTTAVANSGSYVFNRVGGAVFSTVYEPDGAVTRVGWHPGGWAGAESAAGRALLLQAGLPLGPALEAHPDRLTARFGGWAAAGTGSGLVRIEDLAV